MFSPTLSDMFYSVPSLVLPAALGLIAGIGHGVVSHYAGLPLSLLDQALLSPQSSSEIYR